MDRLYLSQNALSVFIQQAADLDGDEEIQADKEITIIDTVTLEGLEVGTKISVKGLADE